MNNKQFYLDLAISYKKLGDEHYSNKNFDESLIYYQRFNDIMEEVYKNDKFDSDIINDLVISFSKLGKIYIKLKNYLEALKFYTKENFFKNKIYNENKIYPDPKNNLANSFYNLGIVYLYLKDNEKSHYNFQKSETLWKELVINYPNYNLYSDSLKDVEKLLKRTEKSNKNIENNKENKKSDKEDKNSNKERVIFNEELNSQDSYNNNDSFKDEIDMVMEYQEQGDRYSSNGEFYKALKYYKKVNKIIEKLSKSDPSLKADLAVSSESIGDTYSNLEEYHNAFFYYKKVMELFKQLYKNDKDDKYKNGLAISYIKMGEALTASSEKDEDFYKIVDYYKKSIKLLEELSNDNKYNNEYKNSLTIIYSMTGDLYQYIDDLYTALDYYKKSTNFFELLYNYDRTDLVVKHDLAISYSKLGNIYLTFEDYSNALDIYKKEMELYRSSYQFDSENLELKTDLALSYQNIGDCYTALEDLKSALPNYKKFNKLMLEAYKIDNNIDIKHGLSVSYDRVGVTYSNLKDSQKGLEFNLKHLELAQEIYDNNITKFPNLKSDLALSYYNLGFNYKNINNNIKAIESFKKSENLFKELIKKEPNNKKYRKDLKDTKNYLELLTPKDKIIKLKKKDKKESIDNMSIDEIKLKIEMIFEKNDSIVGMNTEDIIILDNYIDRVEDIDDYLLLEKIGDFYKNSNYIELALNYFKKAVKRGGVSDKKVKECNQIIKENKKESIDNMSSTTIKFEILSILNNNDTINSMSTEDITEFKAFINRVGRDYDLLEKIGDFYKKSNQLNNALIYYKKTLSVQESEHCPWTEYGAISLTEEIVESELKIASVYKLLGDFKKELKYYKLAIDEFYKTSAYEDKKREISKKIKECKKRIKNKEESRKSISKKNLKQDSEKIINFEKKKETLEEKKIVKELDKKRKDKNRVQIVNDILKTYIEDYREKERRYELNSSDSNMIDLAISYQEAGDQYHKIAEDYNILEFLFSGVKVYKKSNILFKKLYLRNKNSEDLTQMLENSYDKLKILYEIISKYSIELKDYEKANEYLLIDNSLKKEIYELFDNDFFKHDFAISYYNLANFYKNNINNEKAALLNLKLARDLINELIEKYPDYMEFDNISSEINKMLEEIENKK